MEKHNVLAVFGPGTLSASYESQHILYTCRYTRVISQFVQHGVGKYPKTSRETARQTLSALTELINQLHILSLNKSKMVV